MDTSKLLKTVARQAHDDLMADHQEPTHQYVLYVLDEDGSVVRANTADDTTAGQEALKEQADRIHLLSAWVVREPRA